MAETQPTDEVPPCCATGFVHTGTPKGTVVSLASRDAYVVDPPTGRTDKLILFLPDVFGWSLVNARLLCDKLTDLSGLTVVLPDILNGPVLTTDRLDFIMEEAPGFGAKLWKGLKVMASAPYLVGFFARNTDGAVLPQLKTLISELKEEWGAKKIGAVGYCFGGRYAVLVGGGSEPAVNAVVGCHPSRVTVPGDIEALACPTLFLLSETDMFFDEKGRENLKGLFANKEGVPTEVVCYPGTDHGFALKGREDKEEVVKAREDAAVKTAEWFRKYL